MQATASRTWNIDDYRAGWNPRVLYWLKAAGLHPEQIGRRSGEDVPVVTDASGDRNLWTVLYGSWIDARWREWAEGLGFRRRNGQEAHHIALLNGHSDDEFDRWLVGQVEGGAS